MLGMLRLISNQRNYDMYNKSLWRKLFQDVRQERTKSLLSTQEIAFAVAINKGIEWVQIYGIWEICLKHNSSR